MTDKRFKCVFKEHETKNSWSMIKDNQLDKPLYIKDVVDLLNELSEENEHLLQSNRTLGDNLKQEEEENANEYNALLKENEQLRLELETHKHPLWSTREAERKLSEVTDNLADEVKKNGLLNEEINQLRIENMRLKKKDGDGV